MIMPRLASSANSITTDMKRIFFILLLELLWCLPSQAAIGYTGHHVQWFSTDGNGGTSGTLTVTAGSLVPVQFAWYQPITPTFSASGGNTLTCDITQQDESIITSEKICYVKSVLSSGTITFTIACTACFPALAAGEFSGADATSPLEAQTGGTNASASSWQPGNLTGITGTSLVISGMGKLTGGGEPDSIDSGFNLIETIAKGATNLGLGFAYKLSPSSSENPTWSAMGGAMNDLAGSNASFKVASSCTPSKVVFTTQPSNAVVGGSLGTVRVSVEDSGSVVCTGDTSNVTISADGAATWATIQSSSSLTKAAVAGVATWTDLFVSPTAGSGSLHAADGALTAATSSSITISASSGARSMTTLGVGH